MRGMSDKHTKARPGAKARFEGDRGCGTGAGGFQPGNTCGKEDGKGGGAKGAGDGKKKRKPKRTPLAGPKVEKPAKIPSRDTLGDMADDAPEYRDDWKDAEDALSLRTDSQAKKLQREMSRLVERWAELQSDVDDLDDFPSKKNREAQAKKRKAIGEELNLLTQKAKRIIRDVGKTEKTAKRGTVDQAANLLNRTIKAQETLGYWNDSPLADIRDALSDLRKRGGAGSGKMRKALKAAEEEFRVLRDETGVINDDYLDMKGQKNIDEQQARALKQRAGQLLQRTGEWRKRAQALVEQIKARASRTGDKRLFAAAVRMQKLLTRRPSHSTRFGLLDRIGAGYSAMTASPADPGSPAYKTALAAAKKEASQVVGNYKFMRDKVAARQGAMDKYVQGAIKAINASSNVNDVQHFTEQLEIAVRAMSTILSSVKTPFAKAGQKAENCTIETKTLDYAKACPTEREDVKAGLKLMEKADKAVSDKIRTLIAEGKPQDQAVAIALDMKRRGEI